MTESKEELWTHEEVFSRIMKACRRIVRKSPRQQVEWNRVKNHLVPCRLSETGDLIPFEDFTVDKSSIRLILRRGPKEIMRTPQRYAKPEMVDIRDEMFIAHFYTSNWQLWMLGLEIMFNLTYTRLYTAYFQDLNRKDRKKIHQTRSAFCRIEAESRLARYKILCDITGGEWGRFSKHYMKTWTKVAPPIDLRDILTDNSLVIGSSMQEKALYVEIMRDAVTINKYDSPSEYVSDLAQATAARNRQRLGQRRGLVDKNIRPSAWSLSSHITDALKNR